MLNIFLPSIAEAQPVVPPTVLAFVGKISTFILNPLIALMFAIATVYFIYGVVAYIWNPDNAEMREKARLGMIWGIVGMFVMVGVFGIMRILINTIGGDTTLMNYV